jgi:hypothetical protein
MARKASPSTASTMPMIAPMASFLLVLEDGVVYDPEVPEPEVPVVSVTAPAVTVGSRVLVELLKPSCAVCRTVMIEPVETLSQPKSSTPSDGYVQVTQ